VPVSGPVITVIIDCVSGGRRDDWDDQNVDYDATRGTEADDEAEAEADRWRAGSERRRPSTATSQRASADVESLRCCS